MNHILSPDSKLYAIVTRLADLIILNLLFVLTSLPIITVGASLSALYTVAFRFGTPEEGSIARVYFQAFKSNFRISTVMWLCLLAAFIICAVDLLAANASSGFLGYMRFVFWVTLLLCGLIYSYAFPLASQFNNTIFKTLKNALLLSIAYLPRSILLLAVNVVPLVVLFISFEAFLRLSWILILLYYACAAWANTRILRKIFDELMPGKTED